MDAPLLRSLDPPLLCDKEDDFIVLTRERFTAYAQALSEEQALRLLDRLDRSAPGRGAQRFCTRGHLARFTRPATGSPQTMP